MRTILSTIALFSLCGLCAQEYTPTYGRELPRGEILAYPSAEAATAADGGDNRYFTRLTEWNLKDNVFSTPFTVPFAWANRQVLFHLGWASGDYEVRVNGLPVACNADGNNPAEINISKQAKEGRNMLEVILAQPSSVAPLESWKEAPAPAIGGAWLMSQPTLRVRDVVTRTRMGEDGNATAEIAVAVKSEALNPRASRSRSAASTALASRGLSMLLTPSRQRFPVLGSSLTSSVSGTCFTNTIIFILTSRPSSRR